jgi:hypothetical protein
MKLTEEKLYSGVGFIPDIENLDEVLSWQPKKEWVREHEHIKGWMYIPIQYKEFLMDRLFGKYQIDIKQSYETKTGCVVIVTINVVGKSHDGIGSVDFYQGLNSSMGFPMAKTFAISDSLDHFGNIFGRNLNRKDIAPKKVVETNEEETNFIAMVTQRVGKCEDMDTLINLHDETQEEMISKGFTSEQLSKIIKAIFTKRRVNL